MSTALPILLLPQIPNPPVALKPKPFPLSPVLPAFFVHKKQKETVRPCGKSCITVSLTQDLSLFCW